MSGFAVVLCAPSGTGKTTVARALVDRYEDLLFSVSATTREPRAREVEGRDYRFVDRERFRAMVEAGELLEWAEVHGEIYGTPRSNLDRAAAEGRDLILDIDVQGARQIRAARPDSVLIFLLPPSSESMLRRLRSRGSETPEQLARRLNTALAELTALDAFEYVVINDRLDETVEAVRSIIRAERQKRERRQPEIEKLRRALLDELEDAGRE